MTKLIAGQINIRDIGRFKEKAHVLCADKYSALNHQKVTISVKAGASGKVTSEFPNEDLVKSFLMDVRMFILKDKNKFNFENICQFFIEKNFDSQRVSEWLEAYQKILDQDPICIEVGQKNLSVRMVFNTILNEEHFHQEIDQKGMSVIKMSPIIEPLARMKFFEVLAKLRMLLCAFNKQVVEKYLIQYEEKSC
ncbi:MAG: hypothetical protein E6Q06_04590 [Candidatus Moraniibacteriota bacterium]|nr:MAG: hypothetical protein E6Q06_04590 [Candidatus Moranbacteria bacterium]